MKKIIAIAFVLVSISACNLNNRKPTFKRVENVEVVKATLMNTVITADAVVYNPNGVSVYLNKTEIDVFANEVLVTHISQTEHTEISKKSEFNIPLKANFALNKLLEDGNMISNLLNGGLKALKNETIDLQYKGTATFEVAGVEFDVPIDYTDEVVLKK